MSSNCFTFVKKYGKIKNRDLIHFANSRRCKLEKGSSFKSYCKEAKKRFKNGYWQGFCKDRDFILQNAKLNGQDEEEALNSFAKKTKNEIYKTAHKQSEDEIFYKEVCELLDSEEIILNPIMRLIDEEHYKKLEKGEQEDYIMRLSAKFATMRERYRKEKMLG